MNVFQEPKTVEIAGCPVAFSVFSVNQKAKGSKKFNTYPKIFYYEINTNGIDNAKNIQEENASDTINNIEYILEEI